MAIRLYDGAWVTAAHSDQPFQVHKDARNPGVFEVDGFAYDIDARALPTNRDAPFITSILSLQAVRELGLPTDYGR